MVKFYLSSLNRERLECRGSEDSIVGHVPRNLSSRLRHFLKRDVNKTFEEVTGQKVNRGAGYGLEVSCTYRLYGPPAYINRMKELVESLAASGHI